MTFSRVFPSYHPRAGQPTYFVEKFWESVGLPDKEYSFNLPDEYVNYLRLDDIWPKHHTIRAGHRWKPGDKFSPRVWSGTPYQSKQIIIAPDIEVKKVWDFEISGSDFRINERVFGSGSEGDFETLEKIALNDGLTRYDLLDWFKYPKPTGAMQIICWSEYVNY
jgi:hypothetical protein